MNQGVEVKVGTPIVDVLPGAGNTELMARLRVSEMNDIHL